MSARIAHEQAFFSSGDRTVARVIERAASSKAISTRRFAKQVPTRHFTYRETARTKNFCRGRSSTRVCRSRFLKTEHEKSQASLSSLPCPAVEKCTTCGVCPSTWLADAPRHWSRSSRLGRNGRSRATNVKARRPVEAPAGRQPSDQKERRSSRLALRHVRESVNGTERV